MKDQRIIGLFLLILGVFFFVAMTPMISLLTNSDAQALTTQQKKTQKKKKLKSTLTKQGLKAIPSSSAALKSTRKKSGKAIVEANVRVSETPPALPDIAESDISSIFWAPGVVDAIASGSPSQQQCNEFYAGNNAGESGGMGACHMAEAVGYSFESIIGSEISLCYMKNFPSEANLASGGVTVISGTFPDNDVTKIFSPPSGSTSRIVKVNISGSPEGEGEGEGNEGPENVFIRTYSQAENQANQHMYHVDLWFCGEDGGEADEYNLISISQSGKFEMSGLHTDSNGTFYNKVGGYLTVGGGEAAWDASKKRTAFLFSQGEENMFKSYIEIGSNLINIKQLDTFGGGELNKGRIVTRFSGSEPSNLRFLEGAFNIKHGSDSEDSGFKGGTSYGSGYYIADPDNSLKSIVQGQNFSDEFYTEEDLALPDVSFSCNEQPDIELALDMSNPALQEAVAPCVEQEFHDMHFCHDNETVKQADQMYSQACSGPQDEGPNEEGPVLEE